jgi:hypothetical protein
MITGADMFQCPFWAKLTPAEKVVYYDLRIRADKDTKIAFPSLKAIVKDQKLNIKTVIKAIKKLKALKTISIIKKSGKLNKYRLEDYTHLLPVPKNGTTHKNVLPMPISGTALVPKGGIQKGHEKVFEKANISSVPFSKEFEEFWKVCLKKEKKEGTFKEWQKVTADGISPQDLILAMRQYSVIKKSTEIQYVKYPVNWLKEKRWKDCNLSEIKVNQVRLDAHKKAEIKKKETEDQEIARRLSDPETLKKIPDFAKNCFPQKEE